MKNFTTWRKVSVFLGIIGLGIIGIMVADQQDFLAGRVGSEKSIGNGDPDPLVENNTYTPSIKTGTTANVQKVSPSKNSEIDGITPKLTTDSTSVRFSGIIESYSTGCYADGECSITISGKKVITTIGWSQEVVGTVKGIKILDDLEGKVNVRANIYAKKIDGGYTLYGNKNYYIEIK